MNAEWHKQHVLGKGATLEQRMAWHRKHQRQCACRPIPATLQKKMAAASSRTREPAVDEYLASTSPKCRALLRALRKTIHALVPGIHECISYGMPAFRFDGRVVAGFQATSKGCSYYPFSGTTLKTLARDVEGYDHSKSALHFATETPLPVSLVRKLLEARIAEGKRGGSDRKPAECRAVRRHQELVAGRAPTGHVPLRGPSQGAGSGPVGTTQAVSRRTT